jgi:hypothetical protein
MGSSYPNEYVEFRYGAPYTPMTYLSSAANSVYSTEMKSYGQKSTSSAVSAHSSADDNEITVAQESQIAETIDSENQAIVLFTDPTTTTTTTTMMTTKSTSLSPSSPSPSSSSSHDKDESSLPKKEIPDPADEKRCDAYSVCVLHLLSFRDSIAFYLLFHQECRTYTLENQRHLFSSLARRSRSK